jgi:hypothetical protein
MFYNYFWIGKETTTWIEVLWGDCCTCKKIGGLRLVNPEEAITMFLANWMIYAFKPNNSNMQVMLIFCTDGTSTLVC